jgi:A/G-specific adenine glycosylase
MLTWFDANKRDMPWRKSPADPYHVLVSEAMLQQTQVATVIPYFVRFIAAFPTPQALAQAEEQAVMKLWQGLGYYRRARNLQAAARAIVQDHAGHVPATVEGLLALPGIGRYTAGAIASIAHNLPTPLVDGNVMRVLTRWFAIPDSTDLPTTQKELWEIAGALVPTHRPGDFNQSLMELGATLCTPTSPRCLMCPAASFCQAAAQGQPEAFPVRSPKKKPTSVVHDMVFLSQASQYLFLKRPDTGLWAGLWQCPTTEQTVPGREKPSKAALKSLAASLTSQSIPHENLTWVTSFQHQTTHRTITFRIHHAAFTGPPLPVHTPHAWRALDNLQDIPISTAQSKALALFLALWLARNVK